MLEKTFRDFSQKQYTQAELVERIKEYNRQGYQIYIGTDSQRIKNKISVVTCLCFHHQDLGSGKVFYAKEKVGRKHYLGLRSRLWMEAFRSIELAVEITEMSIRPPIIHLDVGENKKALSSNYQQELQFLVTGQGFKCEIKPDSFAACAVADRMSKS